MIWNVALCWETRVRKKNAPVKVSLCLALAAEEVQEYDTLGITAVRMGT